MNIKIWMTMLCLTFLPSLIADEWVMLGECKVDRKTDRDVIQVTAKDGVFNRIKFVVLNNQVEIFDIKVHFGDGGVFDVSIRSTMSPGQSTREIDLPGRNRIIQRVSLLYKTQRVFSKKKAKVQLWGKRLSLPNKHPNNNKPSGKWTYLGSKIASHKSDRDVIVVTGAQGTFRTIKLTVENTSVQMNDFKVFFQNGEVFDVPVRQLIHAGQSTRDIDLPGRSRIITKVVFSYRSVGRGKAKVSLFGRSGGHPGHGHQDWQMLGQRKVDNQRENDEFELRGSERLVSSLRIRVQDRAVKIISVTVFFMNVPPFRLDLGGVVVEPGQNTRPLEFGGNRVVKSVKFVYKSVGPRFGAKHATLELWGK